MKRFVVLMTVALLLGSILPVAVITNVGVVHAESTELPVMNYIIHSQIRINNESDLANQSANEGWSGDGSATNPYIIEGYNITGSGAGIYIGNTTSYFIIRNCYVHNVSYVSSPYYWGASIELYNVSNAVVEGNKLWDSSTGVMFVSTVGSEIYNNTIGESGGYGIYLREGSTNNTVHGNDISGSSIGGVISDSSDLNRVYDNIISSSGSYGIMVHYSASVKVENNNISSCVNGIYAVGGPSYLSTPFEARNNSIRTADIGIYIDAVPQSVIFNNSISDFTTGIEIYAYSNHSIVENNYLRDSLYYTTPKGVLIDHVSYIDVSNNLIENIFANYGTSGGGSGDAAYGIYVSNSMRINITENVITDIQGGSGAAGNAGSEGNPGTSGGTGGDGGYSYGIYVLSSNNDTIESNNISAIHGGNGGNGGDGGNGQTGVAGADGGSGGDGGQAGAGIGIYVSVPDEKIANNSIFDIYGGNGGAGGRGGDGTDGDGYSTPDGKGGAGGRGGDGGDAIGVAVLGERAQIYGNEIHSISSGNGGNGGSGGDSGFADGSGTGGNGGDGGDSGTVTYNGPSGIYLENAPGSTIKWNYLHLVAPGTPGLGGSRGTGSYLDGSEGSDGGTYLSGAIMILTPHTTIFENDVYDNSEYGIYVIGGSASSSRIYHNNFVNNSMGAFDSASNEVWDDGYPSGGNYWSDYAGADNYSGVDQNQAGSDGIGDVPVDIDGGTFQDRYPLMAPWGNGTVVISTQPADGEGSAPVDSNIVIVFNLTMDTNHIPRIGQVEGSRVNYTFAGWSSTNIENDTATWTHENWNYDERIGLRVFDFVDSNGKYGRPHYWYFNTEDISPPQVISTDPADSEESVALSKNVVVIFDDNMDTSITPTLTDYSTGVSYTFAGWSTTNVANDTATWTHTDWPDSTSIMLEVSGARDTGSNEMPPYNWTFTTVDLTRPYVSGTTPADGESGVNKSIDIVIIFSESMDTSYNGGSPTIYVVNGNDTGGWTFLGWSSTYVNNDTARWSHNPWVEKEKMTLGVDNFADLAGNIGYAHSWSFYVEDTHAPHVISTTPADGDVDVLETIDVVIVFNETMDSSSIPVLMQTSGTPVNYTFAGWSTTNVANDTATWTHDPWSTANVGRNVTLVISNYSDNSYNIGENYTWSFVVRDMEAPTVISTDPADGSSGVPMDSIITVVFSESLDSSVTPTITQTSGNSVTYTFLGWSSTNYDNDTAMWSHDNWSEKDQITIKISWYRDVTQNWGNDYYFSFITEDLTPPSVAGTSPYAGQSQVAYNANVSVVFSESMDASRVPTLIQTGGDVVTYTFLGWFKTNVDNDTAIWGHDNWMDSDTVYLTVSDYYDLGGNRGDNYSWHFRIYDTTAPYVIDTSPYDGEKNVSVNLLQISVTYSESMDPYGAPTISYVEAGGNRPNIDFYMWLNDTTAVFNVTGQFSEGDRIELKVYAVQDPYNNDAAPYYWWFYTYDPTPPYVLDVSPAAGSTASKNQNVTVVFSEKMDESTIPLISQLQGDPGGWTFLGWSTEYRNVSGTWKDVSVAVWSHNLWSGETVNLTVSGYRDYAGNLGADYSWEFNVWLYDPHAMIRINSNLEMENMAAMENWTGDGTAENPYRIEWYDISGDDGRGGYCIYIGNTTDYFVIANNSLNYAWTDNPVRPYYPRASVVLYNVINGVVENNEMNVQSDFGVYLYEVSNVSIVGNYIHDYWWNGMNVKNSTVYLENNTLEGGGNGIYMLNSWYSEIDGNFLSGDGNTGITLENSSYVGLFSNTIDGYDSGITFDSGDGATTNITMIGNAMYECGLMIWGWQYEHWTSHTIIDNSVNNRPLIFLNGMDDYTIGPEIQAGQVYMVDCYNISLSEQFIVRATVGVYVAVSSQLHIFNNTIAYNMYGIYMVASTNNRIWHNNFVTNDNQAWDDDSGSNEWNALYPEGGNYWDDYSGNDVYSGPNQDIPGPDGIIDNALPIDGGACEDAYPLIDPTPLVLRYGPGWNMVAFPWLTDPTPINDVLSGTSWDRAMVYLNGTWYTYNADRDAKYNADFPMIDRSMGLWVRFTAFSIVSGPSPIHTGNITIYLHKGWNLVEGVVPIQVQELLNGVEYRWVESANLTDPSVMEQLNDTDILATGRGYWVYVEGDYTVHIDTHNFTVDSMEGIVPDSKGLLQPEDAGPLPVASLNEESAPQGFSMAYTVSMLVMAALSISAFALVQKRRKRV